MMGSGNMREVQEAIVRDFLITLVGQASYAASPSSYKMSNT